MKIGIITLFGLYNYGNRLQNVAVTHLLEQRGHEVHTIVCDRISPRRIVDSIIRMVQPFSAESRKRRRFKAFNKQYIKVKSFIRQNLKMPKSISDQYDLFIVGSDQVWNPEIRKRERDTFFLRFAPTSKRLCISPSIGIEHIDDQYIGDYREGLAGFAHLSCREVQGSKEISRITGRVCQTLIDPTLAISPEYWRSVADYSEIPTSKYIFKFFLSNPSIDITNSIDEYARKHKCIIVDMQDVHSPYYDKGPAYFISLIDKAEAVFTDSFHSVAFSVNLNTPFYAFDRYISEAFGNMSSRILTLLNITGLIDRFLYSNHIIPDTVCSFEQSNAALLMQRTAMQDYLDIILSENK